VANQIVQSLAVKTLRLSGSESVTDEPSKEEQQAIRGFMAAFERAIKSYSLYPGTHTISENLLSGLENSLATFFHTCPDLKLDIEKDRICYKTIEVYHKNGKEDYLATPLFRDGIIWIEFRKGTTAAELSILLGLLNDYRAITDESEGDLVTALWKKNLAHISYEAAEVFWETEPKLDFSHFKVSGSSEETSHGPADLRSDSAVGKPPAGSEDAGKPSTISLTATEVKRSLMQLSAAENEKLQKLIREEEKRDRSEDILDMLLIVLEDENDEKEFGKILELLVQEFENILIYGEFHLAAKLLGHLKEMLGRDPTKKLWRDPMIDQYLDTVSETEFLEALKTCLPKFKSEDSTQLKLLRHVLLMLRPKAVLALGPLLSEAMATPLRLRLMEAIGILSKQDLSPLNQLLKLPDDQMVRHLATIIGHLEGKNPQRLLLNLTRHPSLDVRREVLRQLLKRTGFVQKPFFFLLEDSNPAIRREILSRLASKRMHTSEDSLLEYLSQKEFQISDFDHILACYIALGKCGSSRSIPFLKETLEEWSWWEIFSFSKSPHRRGAALALSELNLAEADKTLDEAAGSFFPPIKRAARGIRPGGRPT
jgi:hypothetical protein